MSIIGPSTERQQSVNDFWSCNLYIPRAIEQGSPTINLSAAIIGKNAIDDIVSASYNWAHTEHQQSLCGISMLHSNARHVVVHKMSFTRSVFSICPCIQLQKYACNVSHIWLFCLKLWCQYLRTRIVLYYKITFGSLTSRITKLSISYSHVGVRIIKCLVAGGYDLFQ